MARMGSTSRDGRAVVDPDAELVVGVARGDPRAARVLVDKHLPRITGLARRMLGDGAEAEDVAQEVFLRVWRHAERWTPGQAKFETWMCRVAMNLCYDRLRRRREVVTDAPPERADETASAFDNLAGRALSAKVEAALAALPPRQRAAVTLCHYQELSNIAAAEILEISVEAVESLLARARRALKQALAAEAAELLESVDGARG